MSCTNKIGILTWHDPTNCGSALQAYALHTYLREMGYDAEIIHYVPQWCRGDYMQMPFKTLSNKKKFLWILKKALVPIYYLSPISIKKHVSPFYHFYYRYCVMTPPCTEENIAEVCKPFTTIISGSDQIWNPDFIDPIFLQTFVSDSTNKISYAASLGRKDIPTDKVHLYKESLSTFSAISIRENDGCTAIQSLGSVAEVHIDPTLLIEAEHYRSIAKSISDIKKPFVFCYFLSTNKEYKSYVQKYANDHNLEIIGVSFDSSDHLWMQKVPVIGPREWLWLIDNASVVLTNSYHATILSLILHTPFFTFLRFDSTSKQSQNARLEQLKEYFSIEDYLINNTDIPEIQPYEFKTFDDRLPALQTKAKEYLLQHIR